MNSSLNDELQKKLSDSFSSIDNNADLNFEARMIMYRFLSEVEKLSEEKNLNRKELATLIGTSASYITQLFRGHKLINLETIAKLQKVFNVTFEINAISLDVSTSYKNLDISNLNKDVEGLWVFHKFSPQYNKPTCSKKPHQKSKFRRIA
jgi:transcriptional regulator with XRE-family HTH domain